ncbi:MAG: S-layer homology domain-containing protein, partial [Eubacteriales bacterium]
MTRFQHMAITAITALTALATVASATFVDQADIEATEAVEVLSAIEIMVGDEAGTFRPNDNVTRAEMAKMVVVLVGETAEGASLFTDCQDSWANGYIATAVEAGFVAGDGDSTFRPQGTVTGLEAGKMLLAALGYDSE